MRLANWVLLYGRGTALVNAVPSAGWRTRLGVSAGTGLEFNLWGFRPYFEGSLLAQSADAPSVIDFSHGRLSLVPQVLAGVALVFD